MPDSKNHYHILQIESNADLSAIKRAYRQQVRRFHPDQFIAERVRLQQAGDSAGVKRLEAEIERAKHMTQRINEAYGVLSDPARRSLYDRSLSQIRQQQYETEIRQQRTRYDADDGRRTVKTRQHSPQKASSDDKLPWLILVGFVSVVLFSTAAFSSFISALSNPFRSYVPDNPTAQGVITSRDLQATAIAEEVTAVARMTLVALPTATPRSVEENIRAARNLYDLGIYEHAIDLYNRAILEVSDDADLYFERGQAQAALFRQGDLQAASAAIADFTLAQSFSSDPLSVQRERGLIYLDLWRVLGTAETMQSAQDDLQAYASEHPDDEMITAALAELAAGNRQEK